MIGPGPQRGTPHPQSSPIRGWCLAGLLLAVMAPSVFAQANPPTAVRPRLLDPTAADRAVDAAVARAIDYLAARQRPNGGWTVDMYQGEATSATALALMAFLAAGHTPGESVLTPKFRKGVQYLLDHQHSNGLLLDHHGHGPLYCHGVSTLFLAEIEGQLEPDQSRPARQALERAVRLILEAQAVRKPPRQAGGWRYTHKTNESDLSVTAWQLLALRAAKNVGCDIPAEAIDDAIRYVEQCGSSDGRGFGYQPGHASSPTMTAAGITALQVCGATDKPLLTSSLDWLAQRLPRPQDGWYFYGAYYASVALHQAGGDVWSRTQPTLFRDLLATQDANGSWVATNGSERPVGPVYSTSLAVLALTVEYGYLPIYQK